MPITNPFGSKSQRKLERKEKRVTKYGADVRVVQAQRAKQQFIEDSQQQRLALNENLARRGMAFSTHAGEQKDMFERANERALANLSEGVNLAEMGEDVQSYGYKVQKRLKPLQILNDITSMAQTAFAGFKGLGGGAQDESGPLDLSEADWG